MRAGDPAPAVELVVRDGDSPAAAPPLPAAKSATDEELMGRLIDGITAVYKELGQAIAPVHLGRMAARLHDEIVAAAETPDEHPAMLKLRLAQLRQELRTAAANPASSKHRA